MRALSVSTRPSRLLGAALAVGLLASPAALISTLARRGRARAGAVDRAVHQGRRRVADSVPSRGQAAWSGPRVGDTDGGRLRPQDHPAELRDPDLGDPGRPPRATAAPPRSPAPRSTLEAWRGLPDFFDLTVTDAAGDVVESASLRFCPNAGEQQRVDPDGPDRRPSRGCRGMPFMYGHRWGIDEGWAGLHHPRPRPQGPGRPLGRHDPRHRGLPIGAGHRPAGRHRRPPATASSTALRRALPRSHRRATGAPPPRSAGRVEGPVVDRTRPRPPARPAVPAGLRRADRPRRGQGLALVRRQRLGRRHLAARHRGLPSPRTRRSWTPSGTSTTATSRSAAPRSATMESTPATATSTGACSSSPATACSTPGPASAVVSSKQSFCVVPTDPVDLSLDGAELRPSETGLDSACGERGALWIRETLPVGWGTPTTRTGAARPSTSPTSPTAPTTSPSRPTRPVSCSRPTRPTTPPTQGDPQGQAGQPHGLRPGGVRHRRQGDCAGAADAQSRWRGPSARSAGLHRAGRVAGPRAPRTGVERGPYAEQLQGEQVVRGGDPRAAVRRHGRTSRLAARAAA